MLEHPVARDGALLLIRAVLGTSLSPGWQKLFIQKLGETPG